MSRINGILSEAKLSSLYPNSGLASKISVPAEDNLWLPSRSLYLNYTMGGGIPYGRICEIFGGESSGKTLVAMDFGYVAQYLGGVILWNDAEQAFDPHWAEANGLRLDRIIINNETSIEKISDWAADHCVFWRSKLTENQPIVLVTDSTAALDCEANINSKQTDAKAEMGNRAKALYKYLRIRNQLFAELGVIVIFINQLRKKVGATMWEDPDCFNYNTLVPLVDGRSLPIGKIVNEKIKGDVWSYNETTKTFEPKPIKGWVKKPGLDRGEKWLSIITDGPGSKGGRFGIVCTPEHGILTTNGWVNAKNIVPGDRVISKYSSKINGSLKSFLIGSFIADSSVRLRDRNTANYRLRDSDNPEYVNWKVRKLSPFFNFRSSGLYIGTEYSVEFGLEAKKIARRNPLRIFDEGIPNPLTLAIWYMDDGHITKRKNPQGSISVSPKRVNLGDLAEKLSYYGYYCKPYSKGIRFSNDGLDLFQRHIRKYIPSCMQYKLTENHRGYYEDFTLSCEEIILPLPVEVISIKEAGKRNYRKLPKYDITVADNHNFIAGGKDNGFIAHNTTPGGDAMKFYASQRLAFFSKKRIKDKVRGHEVWVGNECSVRLKKNKVAPPRPTFSTEIFFNNEYGKVGFNKYANLVELFERTNIVSRKKGSPVFYYKDKSIARGKENLQELLESDGTLRRVMLRKAGINTVKATEKKLEKLKKQGINRYPVVLAKSKKKKEEDE